MDKQLTSTSGSVQEFELQVMLYITEQLFAKGHISKEMRNEAREFILKS